MVRYSTNSIHDLYHDAYEIEAGSQSPRIQKLHDRGEGCKVSLGVTVPEQTKHIFVLYNPGGEVNTYKLSDRQKTIAGSIQEHETKYASMKNYMACDEKLARNLRKFIEIYAAKTGKGFDECVNDFGQVNTSFYPSPRMKELPDLDYYLEVQESFSVMQDELNCKNLRSLIFSGPTIDYFFHKLYKPGAKIKNHKHLKEIKNAFTTVLANGKEVLCIFIKHLSYINNPTVIAGSFHELLQN
jgi:hypothetical protein